MIEIDINRHSHLIDPHLHIWGWQIPVYLFLGGLVAGLMVLSALQTLQWRTEERSRWSRWMAFVAPALLSVGMLALLLDLEYKAHVWRFYTAFRATSPMSWGSWILLLIYPATIGLGLASLTHDETDRLASVAIVRLLRLTTAVRRLADACRKGIRRLVWANLLLGIGLGTYTGILLGAFGARPLWAASVLGPLFFVSGLSTGAALMMLFPISEREYRMVQRWDVGAILVEMMLIGLLFLDLLTTGGEAGREAARLFLGGPYTAAFWAIVVLSGLVVPLGLELLEMSKNRRPLWLTPTLILIAGFTLRWVLVYAGQA
ncbi:MAG: polysulfide reductase NrfD [Planctomycetes bacterium]|nr:polysulfide reductase NrfD [Planctomycetota bacterium]